MKTLRDIRGRLHSISKNRQIMRAMKMVSAVKLRRIQAAVQESRPYALRLAALTHTLLNSDHCLSQQHPLMCERPVKQALWVVFSTDRGLCGSLNTGLFRFVHQELRSHPAEHGGIKLLLVGQAACDYFNRAKIGVQIEQEFPLVEAEAEGMARKICGMYAQLQTDRVDLFYPECKSVLRQVPVRAPFLPVALATCSPETPPKKTQLFEPSREMIAGELLPRYLGNRLRQVLFEVQLSEHSARMIMMDQASKNAVDMLDQIQLDFNKLRQFMITRELTDIITGVEAMT